MSILKNVTTGKTSPPMRLMVTGVAGVGKTSFAAGAPKPLFLDCERRTEHLDVARLSIKSWDELTAAMTELGAGGSGYETVVVDTLDHAELMLWESLCTKNKWGSIEDPGFGKGYVAALEHWRKFSASMERLRDVGLHVILIAHAEIKTVSPPDGDNYDSWVIKLHRRAAGLLTEKMDAVGFAKFDDVSVKKRGDLKAKAVAGDRVLCFGHTPAYYTKAGLGLPDQVALTWTDFDAAKS